MRYGLPPPHTHTHPHTHIWTPPVLHTSTYQPLHTVNGDRVLVVQSHTLVPPPPLHRVQCTPIQRPIAGQLLVAIHVCGCVSLMHRSATSHSIAYSNYSGSWVCVRMPAELCVPSPHEGDLNMCPAWDAPLPHTIYEPTLRCWWPTVVCTRRHIHCCSMGSI